MEGVGWFGELVGGGNRVVGEMVSILFPALSRLPYRLDKTRNFPVATTKRLTESIGSTPYSPNRIPVN